MPAEIRQFETREARTQRLTEQRIAESVPAATFTNTTEPEPEIAPGPVTPVDRTNTELCTQLIRDRSASLYKLMYEGYEHTFGHACSPFALERYLLLANLIAMVDCRELLGFAHPYTEAFEQFIEQTQRTK